jgi:catechol-2,3-dioxygenase
MNKWKDWLKEKNVSLDDERGDKSSAGIYFHDPDGYTIEIYFVKESY